MGSGRGPVATSPSQHEHRGGGVGGDAGARLGQRAKYRVCRWAGGVYRSAKPEPNRNTGSGPRPDKSGRGSTVDTGDRSSRGEDRKGRPTRSGSKSNAS